jgi:hypothetical protein
MLPALRAPRVFIRYSQESTEHEARVLALSERLKDDGVRVVIDLPGGGLAGLDGQTDTRGRLTGSTAGIREACHRLDSGARPQARPAKVRTRRIVAEDRPPQPLRLHGEAD